MLLSMRGHAVLGLFATIALTACSGHGRGLPPGGPAPGEVEVGYGAQPRDEVTGALTSIPESELIGSKDVRVEDYLRGRVAGLQVVRRADGRPGFRIRGMNSLLSDQEPLFVVDGVPVPSENLPLALAALTPKDIRQVDVLKDVASTTIYGMRGAGGVIVITTRR
jgi:TonB-dependent SusC/RagA subfamily outer membrane receptor